MGKTIVRFCCSNCNEISSREFWGISLPKNFDEIKNRIIKKHKTEDDCMGIVEATTEYVVPSVYIDKLVAYFNHNYREFMLGEITEDRSYGDMKRYYTIDKHTGGYSNVDLEIKYNYIGSLNVESILSNFHALAFIDEFAYIQMGFIEEIISKKVGNTVKNYITVKGKNSFDILDMKELSEFIRYFDMFNFKTTVDPKEKEKIINHMKKYKKFRNYWIKKYYVNNNI